MVSPGSSPAAAGIRLEVLALAVSSGRRSPGRFAALYAAGGDSVEVLDSATLDRLARLAEGVPVVTATPKGAYALLDGGGATQTPLVWDVLDLAGLLVPECPTTSLDGVAAFFGLAREGSSLEADARLVLGVFQVLLAVLDQTDTQTLLHASRLALPLDWPLRALLAEVERARAKSTLETGALAEGTPIGAWVTQGAPRSRRRAAPEPPASPPALLDLDEVAQHLAPTSAIARSLPAYEPRQEQVEMAQIVGDTLNSGGQALIEAGTGVGKSLAYLVPAALQAVRNRTRVVVSTATITLQDQLFEKDLPAVQASLGADVPLRATVLKGRGNYLCLRRWQTLLHATDLSQDDRSLLIKTLFWLPRTRTGDRAELRLTPGEEQAWQRLSAVAEACTPQRCSYHRIGVCFLARARRTAEESHIVITNHALLLSDLVTRSRVLPDYQALILDEAHHLEDEATQQLGWRISERELLGRLERLWSPGLGHHGTGAVAEALALVASAHGLRVPADLLPDLHRGERAVLGLGSQIRLFFEGLGELLGESHTAGDESTLPLSGAVRAGSRWQQLEAVWAEATEYLREVERLIPLVQAHLDRLPEEAAKDLSSELASQLEAWRDVRHRLAAAVHAPEPGTVYWVAGASRQRFGSAVRTAWLSAAPLEVAGLLKQKLFAATETTVLVSATLSIGGSFDYVKRRLGLEEAAAVALGSPFDYRRNALLYVPNDLPDPTQPGHQALLERVLLDSVARLGGRTLVLFTSRAHLRSTYHALREPLAGLGVTLLGQGINEGSRTRLLDSFRRGSRVVLFGTNAFWEGIDVVGEALSCVVVTRLPFAVPSDPMYAARAEQFEDPFAEYAVPLAVLRLKQGFGRLIRARTDRGAVVVMDRRLVTRFYGNVFLRSLPPCSVKQGPASRAGLEVEEWVSQAAAQQLTLVPG